MTLTKEHRFTLPLIVCATNVIQNKEIHISNKFKTQSGTGKREVPSISLQCFLMTLLKDIVRGIQQSSMHIPIGILPDYKVVWPDAEVDSR